MIPLELLVEIRRLLDEGRFSQRQISVRLRVSRGMVQSVAHGRRALTNPQRPERRRRRCRVLPPRSPRGLPVRCPGCGGLVYAPCLLCATRAQQRRSELAARPIDPRRAA